MARDFLPFDDDAPGLTKIDHETTFAGGPTAAAYFKPVGNPGGLENIKRASVEDAAQSTSFNKRNNLIMAKSGVLPAGTTMNLIMDLCGYTSTSPGSFSDTTISDAQAWTYFKLLKSLFGAQSSSIVSAVDGVPANLYTFDVSAGDGASFEIGQAVLVPVGGSYEVGFIKNIATDTITLRWPLSLAATNTAQVIGGTTFWPADSNKDSTLGMTWQGFIESGESTSLSAAIAGMSGQSASLTLPAEGPARWDQTMLCATGVQDYATTDLDIAPAWAYPGAEDMRGNFSVTLITDPDDETSAARVEVFPEGDVTVAFDMGTVQAPSGASDYGVTGQDVTKSECSVSFNLRRGAETDWQGYFDAQTILGVEIAFGSQPGKTWALCLPTTTMTACDGPNAGDGGAVDAITLTAAQNNNGDGSRTSDNGASRPFFLAAM